MTMDKQFKIIKINKKTAELEPINADNCNTCDTEGGCGIASLDVFSVDKILPIQ